MARLLARIRSLARRFLLLTIVFIGSLCGVLAVLFHRYVEVVHTVLIGRALAQPEPWRSLLVVTTPALMFAGLAWSVGRFAPRAVGANLARVRIAYNNNPKALGLRSIAATFLATSLSRCRRSARPGRTDRRRHKRRLRCGWPNAEASETSAE